jgi:HD-GYP domain-containing protein (c-di-GMP phosphodiesterase class II)
VSVCDAYEAMTADRSYRAAVTHELACRELRRSASTQFDPTVVDAFLTEIETAGEERDLNAVQHAAEHVRMLLGIRAGAPQG